MRMHVNYTQFQSSKQRYKKDAPKRKHVSGSAARRTSKSNPFSKCTVWSVEEDSAVSAFLIRHLCRIQIVHIRKLADELNRPVRATLCKAYTMQKKICERKSDKKWVLKSFENNHGDNLAFQSIPTTADVRSHCEPYLLLTKNHKDAFTICLCENLILIICENIGTKRTCST